MNVTGYIQAPEQSGFKVQTEITGGGQIILREVFLNPLFEGLMEIGLLGVFKLRGIHVWI
jgi:hypothetical protein